ncbi:MAG: hypothetical protein ICV83_22940, partial [Cytophagales bacterium]|nr:hypothetical protein [Cytophagales bacterium]
MVPIGKLQQLTLFVVVGLCFVGMNVLESVGYVMGTNATNPLTKIHPLTYCMAGVLVANLL